MLDVDSGITVDNITIDGTEIDLSSGDLTIDVAGDIILDADGGDFIFKDGGSGDEANKVIRFSTPSHDTDEENVQILQVESEGAFNQISFGGGTSALNASTKLRFLTAGVDTTTGVERISIDSSGNIVFNDTSVDSDFRVESNGNANMLFVDGGNDQVRVGSTDSVANTALRVEGAIKCSFSSGVPTNQSFNQFTEAGANTYNTHFRNYSSNPLAQYILDVSFANASPDNGTAKFVDFRDSTTARCQIRSDGDVINHDNSYGAISDIKLKEQITDASSQWDDIKALTVRKFKFKTDVATGDSDAHWRLGVIAQEVETAGMNNLVTIDADVEFSEDGIISETGTVTKTVKYSVLYMKAVKALQEAMTKIETLETQNNLQETSINDLQKRITALESA